MCCEEIFLKRLQDRGFRLTPQRDVILQAMHHVDGHATAEEIHGKVHSISSAIDISTVYRTLELLQELHLVAAVDLVDINIPLPMTEEQTEELREELTEEELTLDEIEAEIEKNEWASAKIKITIYSYKGE